MGTLSILLPQAKSMFDEYEISLVKKGLMILSGSDVYFLDDLSKRKRAGFEFPSDIIGAGKDTACKYIARRIIGRDPIVMKEAVVFSNM